MKLKVDAHLWCLGTYAERYVPGGYWETLEVGKQLEIMSRIDGLDGVFVFFPTPPLPADPVKLKQYLAEYGLKPSNLGVENWGDKRWKHGAFSSTDARTRRECIDMCRKGIDFAAAMEAESVLLWPAHDGFDYPFQAQYRDGWKYLVDTIREIGEYNPSMKMAVEYKSKDPRQKQYVSNVGKLMMLLNDVNLPNVTGVVDVGHALMAQENLAESLVILDAHGKLGQIHLNENYKDSDPDMIFGSINFWEILEFFYYLNQTDFEGWSSVDIISAREDREKALRLGVSLIWTYQHLAERLLEHSQQIEDHLQGYHFTENMELMTQLLFPRP